MEIMFGKVQRLDSSNETVSKYIFTSDDAIAEAVLYTYGGAKNRTVVCCSVMSGCPVGCTFCGTGNKFIRNLNENEIVYQVGYIFSEVFGELVKDVISNKLQIMFMSMGEPLLNWQETSNAIIRLNAKYPQAELLISTIAPMGIESLRGMLELSKKIDKIGLQFSIHESTDAKRNKLIPYNNKLNLTQIKDLGITWYYATGRKVFLNYCVTPDNSSFEDFKNLTNLFSPRIFNFTFSVVCNKDETMRAAGERNLGLIKGFEKLFIDQRYNTRTFDPAGQDDIGGGCGQLWKVQNWMKEH